MSCADIDYLDYLNLFCSKKMSLFLLRSAPEGSEPLDMAKETVGEPRSARSSI
jgi:hypothetical protein